ncbi:hypothetical protein [Streptomyces sp. NPDC056304]|uniref:hypothetical protein n=1 Tax=Streptomyces sp. NPDC056304 TaxID=3345778 RepID=UPI0035D6CE92
MSKADATTAGRVTADWTKVFGGFDTWRPLRLLRRVGPVVQGVTLDRSTSGDAYYPTTHIHALTRPFPVISLTLGQRLVSNSGMQEAIRFARHAEDHLDASRRLAEQARLSLDAPPSVGDIVKELHAFAVAQYELDNPPALNEVEDSVLISSASGDKLLAEQGIQLARELVGKWPKSRIPLNWTSEEEWITSLTEKAANPEGLCAIVESQITLHKLAKIRQS